MCIYIYIYIYIHDNSVITCIVEDDTLLGESRRNMNSFQTTLTPNPEKLYRYCSVVKR